MFTDETLTIIEKWLSKNRSVHFLVTKSRPDAAGRNPTIMLSIIKPGANYAKIESLLSRLSSNDYKMFNQAIMTIERSIYNNLTKDPCMAALIQAEIDEVWESSHHNCELLQNRLNDLLHTALAKQLICNSVGPNW